MSGARSDGDTWDIATSVGSTAVLVAAARAAETQSPDPLISDPYARTLVEGVGPGMWEQMLDTSMVDRLHELDPEMALIFRHMRNYQAVRTHFFDAFFADAVQAGVRQIVILASGLDSRAYRLDWPSDTVLFEIDQPKVLEYKAARLAAVGIGPAVERHEVAVDLRFDWPAALTAAGFDAARPTAWLAEGLLMYLPSDAQDRLFEQITALSALGSRIAAETAGRRSERRREEMRARFDRVAGQLGMPRNIDLAELMYDDPDRAELTGWLQAAGWSATGVPARDEMQRLDRWLNVSLTDDDDALSWFVVAQRR